MGDWVTKVHVLVVGLSVFFGLWRLRVSSPAWCDVLLTLHPEFVCPADPSW